VYTKLREALAGQQIEQVGKPLRDMMSWLGSAAKEMDAS
jgi:ketol-acid reductoisomerase